MVQIKQRIAVQANEYYKRDDKILPYDFVIATVTKGGSELQISYFLDDVHSRASEIAVNDGAAYIFCWEIPEEVIKPERLEWISEGSPIKLSKNLS